MKYWVVEFQRRGADWPRLRVVTEGSDVAEAIRDLEADPGAFRWARVTKYRARGDEGKVTWELDDA